MGVDCRKCKYACMTFDEFYARCKDAVDEILKKTNTKLEDYKKMIEDIMKLHKKNYKVVILCAKTLSLRVANPERPTQSFECEYYEEKA